MSTILSKESRALSSLSQAAKMQAYPKSVRCCVCNREAGEDLALTARICVKDILFYCSAHY